MTTKIKKNFNITTSTLKIVAMTCMLIDHVAAGLYADFIAQFNYGYMIYMIMRIIGRASFPIYAFLISEGIRHTSSKKRYLTRLFICGVISEPIYDLTFFGGLFIPQDQNIMFSLFLSAAILSVINKTENNRYISEYKKNGIACASVIAGCILSEIFSMDYGAAGILTVIIFYYIKDRKAAGCLSVMNLTALNNIYEIFAVTAVPLIALYNGKKGKLQSNKYIFYAFYPMHILLIYLIGRLITL